MKTKIYQICYSEETLAQVPEGFLVLDNTDNSRADWREYWPIRNVLKTVEFGDHDYVGFFHQSLLRKQA